MAKTKAKAKKKKIVQEMDQITMIQPDRPYNPDLPKNHYFDNQYVEKLLKEYVWGGCTDVVLRDKIMENASELIRQIIRTHKLHMLTGRDGTSFGDLYQIAWLQVESSLYKFDCRPGHTKVFNMWCVTPDTMLITDNGLDTIGNMLYSGVGIKNQVYGLDGFNSLTATLCRPKAKTLKIKTRLGYQIEATPEHRFYVLKQDGPKWIEAGNLSNNDLIAIQYDQQVFHNDDSIDVGLTKRGDWTPPDQINEELAYIIGLYIAKGSWSHNKLVIYNIDEDVINTLVQNSLGLNFTHEQEYQRISLCNVRFIEFLQCLGFKSDSRSHIKNIPSKLLMCSKSVIKSMLRGMFDGDGHSSVHNGEVGYTSSSIFLINQLRNLLLNMGYVSELSEDVRTQSTFDGIVRPRRIGYQLLLSTNDSAKFYDDIGFNIDRKVQKSKYLKKSKVEMFGLIPHFQQLKKDYGCGSLGYDSIRPLLKNKSGMCFLEQSIQRLKNWENYSDDSSYVFIENRIEERTRPNNKIVWLPVVSIKESSSPVCEVTVDSPDHSYIANGFVSHNSQVAKTVMLAHIKKESRDKRNYGAYKDHLDLKGRPANYKFQRFVAEASEIFKFDDEGLKVIEAMKHLADHDHKPYDGLIDKLSKRSGLSRSKVSALLRMIRLRSFEFSDSPVNNQPVIPENKYRVSHHNYDSDED